MFKSILIPIDFSESSSKVIQYGFFFAERFKAKLKFLHALIPMEDFFENAQSFGEYQKMIAKREVQISEKFQIYQNEARKRGIKANSVIVRGFSESDSISHFLSENMFDLVFVGTRGRSHTRQTVMGSIAESIVRISPVPVLTVPENVGFDSVKKILVPLDFSLHSLNTLEIAASLADTFQSQIFFYHVIEQGDHPSIYSSGIESVFEVDPNLKMKVLEHMQAFVFDYVPQKLVGDYIITEGKPHKCIVDYAAANDIDLIVIATHGLSGLEYLLMGSTAEKVVRWSECPNLLVKNVH
jgi:nucleotide-binding universal stress UspA family protein